MTDRSAFAEIVRRGEERLDLALAALLLARIHEPVERPERYVRLLDDDADRLRPRLDPDGGPARVMGEVGRYLAGERGFRGNAEEYYDPRNSCLNAVLDRRLGLPITLSVVYLEVGWRLGLPLAGVGMPGHFLVKHAGDDGPAVIVDPFGGGALLSEADCAERLRRVHGRPVPLEPHYLAAVTRKQILARMLTNLKHIYLSPASLDYARALDTIEHLLLLSPWALDQVRDRGLVQWQLGHTEAAIVDLETYLQYAGDAADAPLIQQRLAGLRRRLPPGW
jgi:regulator of sirC expression with transglutaminase-like and TPR domain